MAAGLSLDDNLNFCGRIQAKKNDNCRGELSLGSCWENKIVRRYGGGIVDPQERNSISRDEGLEDKKVPICCLP